MTASNDSVITRFPSPPSAGLRSFALSPAVEAVIVGLLGQALLVGTGPMIARLLGPTGRGELAVLQLWPMILTEIGGMGIPVGIAYTFASTQRYSHQVFRHSTIILSTTSALTSGIVLFALSILRPDLAHPSIVLACIVMIWAGTAYRLGLGILQGLEAWGPFALLRLLPTASYFTLVLFCFVRSIPSVLLLSWCWAMSLALGALFTHLLIPSRSLTRAHSSSNSSVRDVITFGLRGHVSSLAPLEGLKLDQVVGSLAFAAPSLGLYVVASAFSNLPKIVAQSIGMIAFPSLAATGASSRKERGSTYLARSGVIVLALVLMTLVSVPYLLPLLFGGEFSDAVPASQLLIVAGGFAALRRLIGDCLRGIGRPGISSLAELTLLVSFVSTAALVAGALTPLILALALCGIQLFGLVVSLVLWHHAV